MAKKRSKKANMKAIRRRWRDESPQPKFKIGDFVIDRDGSRFGRVETYVVDRGVWSYKVQELNGPRHTWNETSMRKLPSTSPEYKSLAKARMQSRSTKNPSVARVSNPRNY